MPTQAWSTKSTLTMRACEACPICGRGACVWSDAVPCWEAEGAAERSGSHGPTFLFLWQQLWSEEGLTKTSTGQGPNAHAEPVARCALPMAKGGVEHELWEGKRPRESGTISGRSSVPAAGPVTACRHKLGQQKVRSQCAHVKLAPFVDGAPVSGLMQCPVGRQKGLLRGVDRTVPLSFFSGSNSGVRKASRKHPRARARTHTLSLWRVVRSHLYR